MNIIYPRKILFLSLSTLALLAGCSDACVPQPPALIMQGCDQDVDVDSIPAREFSMAPYLINPTTDGVTIQFEAMDDAPAYLLWGPEGEYTTLTCLQAPKKIPVVSDEISEQHDGWLYSITLRGLDAHKRYQYTVPGAQIPISDPDDVYTGEYRWKEFGRQTLLTAAKPEQDFSIVIYGDNMPLAYPHQIVVDTILLHPANVVVHLGDMVFQGEISQYRSNYLRMASPLMRMMPHFHVAGNHEGYGEVIPFDTIFPMPPGEQVSDANGPIDPGSRVGVFDYGNARFFALYSERDMDEGSMQLAWLDAQLENTVHHHPEIKWLFGTWHRPTHTRSNAQLLAPREAVDAVLKKWRVDAVFNGHVHCYERLQYDGRTYIIAGGGGAPLTDTDNHPTMEGEEQVTATKAYSFLRAEFSGAQAHFTAYKADDDSVIDDFVLHVQDRSDL